MKNNSLFKQKQILLLGALNQLLGSALAWVSMPTFIFSAIAAWNTPTIGYLRDLFPWLNIGIFTAIIFLGIAFAMWLQHKYVQPSTVDYWRKMFYENNVSEERMKRIELRQKILCQIILMNLPKDKYDEIKNKLDEIER